MLDGSVEKFAQMMNKKAQEMELLNTHFVTPHGLDEASHYTTAYELALITDYALNIEKFVQIVSTKEFIVRKNTENIHVVNTNELLGYLKGVNGVKTGYTGMAGRCLVTAINRDDFNIICVVLGADTKKFRTADSVKIIEYVYSNYKLINVKDYIEKEVNLVKDKIKIHKSIENIPKIYTKELAYTYLPIKDEKIDIRIEIMSNIISPMEKDSIIGNVILKENTREIIVLDILISEKIYRKDIKNYFADLLSIIKFK